MGNRNADQTRERRGDNLTPNDEDNYGLRGRERREYRGKESYEQQSRGGEGGRSGMWDHRHVPRDIDERYRSNADQDQRGYQNVGQRAEFVSDYTEAREPILATQLLEKQHRKIEEIFSKLEADNPDAETLLTELANGLAAHMTIEQEIFYPAIQNIDRMQVFESYEEHALAEVALKRLLAADPAADEFKARVTALKELIGHHLEKEEDELFPKVEKELDEAKLKELGARMHERFEKVVKAGYESAVPRGFAKTSSDVSKKALKKSNHGGRKRAA